MSLEMSALFRKYAGTLANIDLQENQAKQQAAVSQRERKTTHKDNLKTLSEDMSGRGLAHSGIALGKNVKLRKAFEQSNADADAALQTVLTNVAKQRLAAQQEYDSARAADQLARIGMA